ncbi:hypothetical protein LGM39_30850 [Burkholderia cepacia]|uniref:hypothetical protein n=1 Tax=Burkholderia cepacia TaxID=292 RepID=UPI000AFFC377|nr:hypothetical protein [Burkholderia cepacia]MCA7903769.1 hypothetical protein [Burkholderia cepacia]HDR9500602.1 hypothetical protein [Burkholderia cepacia]
MTTLPHANHQQISDLQFLAAWDFWFRRFQPKLDPLTDSMPRLASIEPLANRVNAGVRFALEIMCRLLVTPPYRNTKQASREMVQANLHLLEHAVAVNPITGRMVKGVRLTAEGRKLLEEIRVAPALEAFADAWDEGDGIQEDSEDVIDVLRTVDAAVQPDFPNEIIEQLVTDIHTDEFIPTYRNRPLGAPVKGWRARLDAYFWPHPATGYAKTSAALAPMLDTARQLADSIGNWTEGQQKLAVEFAESVFLWGGVSQRKPYEWQHVEAVFASAIEGRTRNGARMNSGWTKVAAFATAHLEPERSLVIWDSRVAHSLIKRIDRILLNQNHREVPTHFDHIGWVPGRGGSRTERNPYALKGWRSGYGKWSSVYAGSALVRAIRDELNNRERRTPAGAAGSQPWTLREVEMVLFMDGY